MPDHFEDHWVAEYWDAKQARWMMVDPQLDNFQREALGVTFDTLDMPAGRFVSGGRAWQMARRGDADPAQFGIFDMQGIAFIRGNAIRDFLALNQIELLPWDAWGLIEPCDEDAAHKDAEMIDRIAELTLAGDAGFEDLRALYERDARLHMPPGWQP
jgi:hypothetical protein